ncbi:hypothetical protein CEUSTIGMA_g4609.t1 [Chlamydomonas eustigma]|uniref:Transcription factor CBF/NF-Y/archaeal histone domain-containing protein n=1 Tax=Chlamydomonas eustigma TaxID=1157962 RepID=A0A250X237_9CHLO|nr:hypothetical protein CEUSTIGMA_g4609.t1 [Chlamydomonas eustigma]|eukprot:GAX77164.1 hypothetical protein CEUSTIGMA_g4609.t1 [Chlamydomonas eustigma]
MDSELPKAHIKRIISCQLQCGPNEKGLAISKDGLTAFSESSKIFISYITSTANEICKESKRQTISAEDVIKAVEELEFSDLVPPLRDYLETYKKWSKDRNAKRSEALKASKKRKSEASAAETIEAGEHAGVCTEDNKNVQLDCIAAVEHDNDLEAPEAAGIKDVTDKPATLDPPQSDLAAASHLMEA